MEFASILQFLQEQKELGLHQNDKGVVLCKLNWNDFCSRLPFSWSVQCPNVCPLCVKQLSSRFSLSRHYVDVHHREEKRLPQQASCQLCHKKLYNRSTLKRHLLTVHGRQLAVDSSLQLSSVDAEHDVSTASQEYNHYLPTLSESVDECSYDMPAVSSCDEDMSSTACDGALMDAPSTKLSVCDRRFRATDAVPKDAVGFGVKGAVGYAEGRHGSTVPTAHVTSVSSNNKNINNNGPASSCNNNNNISSVRPVVDTVCPLCPGRSDVVHDLPRHVLKRHCCRCPRCHVQLPVLLLNRHIDAHRQQSAFWCPVCGAREGERVDMLRHISQRHEFIAEGSQFHCSTCGHVRSENLTTHCLQHARRQALTAHSHRGDELLPGDVMGVRLGRLLLNGVDRSSPARGCCRSRGRSRKRCRPDSFEAGVVIVVRDSPGQALSFLPETDAAVSPPVADTVVGAAEESAAVSPPVTDTAIGAAEEGAAVFPPVTDTAVGAAEESAAVFPPVTDTAVGAAEESAAVFPPVAGTGVGAAMDGVISVWTPPAENVFSSGLGDDIPSVVSGLPLSLRSTSRTTADGGGAVSLDEVAPLRAEKLRSLSLDFDLLQNPVVESVLFPSVSRPSVGSSARPAAAAADDELLGPVSVSALDSSAGLQPGGTRGDVIESAWVTDNRSRTEFCPTVAGSRAAERQLSGCVSVQLVDAMDRPSWPVNAAQLLTESLCTVCAGPVPGGHQLADHLLRHGRIPLYFCSSCQHTFNQPSAVTAAHSCRPDSCHRTQLLCLLCGLQVSGEDVTVHWLLHSMDDPLCHQLLYADACISDSLHRLDVSNGTAVRPASASDDCGSACCVSEALKREPYVGVITSGRRAGDFSTVSEADPVVLGRNSTLPAGVNVDASTDGVPKSSTQGELSTRGELPADQRHGSVTTGRSQLEDQVESTDAGSGAGKRCRVDEAALLESVCTSLKEHINIAHLESSGSPYSVSTSQCVQYVNGCNMSEASNNRVTDVLVSPEGDVCGSGNVDRRLGGSGEAATLQCPECPAAASRRRFFSPCQLRRHCLWRHGTRRGPHRCRRCPSRFFLLGQLRAHLCCDTTLSRRLCPRCCTPLRSRQLRSSNGRLSEPVLVCDSCLLPASSPNGLAGDGVAPDGRPQGDVAPDGRPQGDVAPDGQPRGDGDVDQAACAWPACCARCDVPVGRNTAAVRWSDDALPCRLCIPCARHWLLLRPDDAPLLWFPYSDASSQLAAALWCPSCCQPLSSLHQLRTHNLLHHAELE